MVMSRKISIHLLLIILLGIAIYPSFNIKSYLSYTNESMEDVGCCYLTDVDMDLLKDRSFKILIIEMDEINEKDVSTLHNFNKLILAYINFGFAEKWRDYWSRISNSSLVHGASMYEGEYYIEFWRVEWENIILSEADKAFKMGFDGVFLDNVEIGMILNESKPRWLDNLNVARLVVGSIYNLSNTLKMRYGTEFKVFVNIGSAYELLYNNRFIDSIDGVLIEELFHRYYNGKSIKIDLSSVKQVIDALKHASDKGKPVIVSDPIDTEVEARAFCKAIRELGFIPIPQPTYAWNYNRPPPKEWYSS